MSGLSIGILGAANIARLFITNVRSSPKVAIRAVASRDIERGRKFADEFGIDKVHTTYEALLADPAIDAVYNPLPNTLHAQWSIRAADAGKHVLCEKPLAMSGAEAVAIFAAARRNGVHVVEGYPYRAQPQTKKLRELLASGAIGSVQTIQAAFGFPLVDPANIRLNATLGGGALMDAGSYPVSFVRMVAGARPTHVTARARWAESGVDRSLAGTLAFASGILAQVSCSFATARHRRGYVVGDAGTITSTYLNETSQDLPPVLTITRGTGLDAVQETIETATGKGFLLQAEAFADLVAYGASHWPGATPEESIDIAFTLEALARSARDDTAIELPQ